ncbi:PAS domain-containing sensor histidine kinase [Ilumatobacter fluminis]|nr:ATP-binding protein [Ilumatobacter fluminis]
MPDLPWRRFFEDAPVPLSIIDAYGRQVACNEAYATLFGYTVDEMLALDVGRITRPEDHEWSTTYLMRLTNGDLESFETDKWYVHRDGTEFVQHLSVARLADEDGLCEYLLGVLLPPSRGPVVGGETAAERLLAYTDGSITLVGGDGRIKFSKGELVEVAGYPTTFWADRDIRDLFPGGEFAHLVADHHEFLDTPGASFETEVELERGDGRRQLSSVKAYNCTDDDLLDGFVLTTRDITDERAHLDDLAKRHQTAEEVADAQTRLLATVSHELRNPLHAVRGLAEILTREDLPPRAAELADGLVRQLSGLTHVTQDLLDAARLDAGKVDIFPIPTELDGLVGDVVGLGNAAAIDKPVTVSHRIARDVPEWVMADDGRLRQVLSNLVGNAVKFTESGTVQIVVRREGENALVFSVIDTGAGIPADEQAAVLEPFRVASTAGEARGAGLGLSIVQRLVTAMGGRVTLTSKVGEGTRFDVVIPLRTAKPPETQQTDELPPGLRVLVVEDNPVNQQLARSQLDRLGVEAVIVDRGEAGHAMLLDPDAGRFDAVFMDQQLPGWNGTEATEHIRAEGGDLATIPIIGLSASASTADRDAFLASGMTDFVAKPASLDDLSSALKRAVFETAAPARVETAAPEESPADETPALDEAVLGKLSDELGSPDIVRDLVGTFLDELDARVLTIVGDDETESRRAAHTLKSSARLLGASALADRCANIEQDGGPADDIEQLARRTETAFRDWLAAS